MDIKIIVAAHKKAEMPSDPCYLPLHVGKAGKESIGYTGDDTGDNISAKNPSFCELTGIYWAWKNLKADYVGLVHYRRLFVNGYPQSEQTKMMAALGQSDFERLLEKADVVMPDKQYYVIETNQSHYDHAHYRRDLLVTIEVLKEMYPDAAEACDKVMNRRSAHMFNIFVMKRDKFDDYCNFMFPLLFEVEKRIDISAYNAFEARVFGRLSEILMDVWLEWRNVKYVEQRITFVGNMNWPSKIYSFLKGKIIGGQEPPK